MWQALRHKLRRRKRRGTNWHSRTSTSRASPGNAILTTPAVQATTHHQISLQFQGPRHHLHLQDAGCRTNHGIDIFALCSLLGRTLKRYESERLTGLQNKVNDAMTGRGSWLKILFHVPNSIRLLQLQKERIYAAQWTLNQTLYGTRQDPMSHVEAKAMAEVRAPPLPPVQRPVNAPRLRTNAAPHIDHYEPPREVMAPQTDHYEPQREGPARELTLTLPPLNIKADPEMIEMALKMVTEVENLVNHGSGPRVSIALSEQDAWNVEVFRLTSVAVDFRTSYLRFLRYGSTFLTGSVPNSRLPSQGF
jgi:hypothetical protein